MQHLAKFREIVLHVGPAKTGTTSIQRALLKFRAELLSAGIYYPETEPPNGEGQHPLAWEILEASGTDPLRWSTAHLSWRQVFDGAERAGAHTILISSEYFSSFQDGPAFRRLRSVTGDVPITLLFGLRDPVTLVCSHWQQGIKWAVGDGEELLSLDNAVPVLLQRWSVQVRPFIELAMTHLKPVRVRFFTVPGNPDTRLLLNQIGHAAGLPEPLLTRFSGIEAEAQNESLTDEDCHLLLALNKLLFSPDSKHAAHAQRGSALYLEARGWILEQLRRDSDSEKTPSKVTGEALRTLVQLRTDILSWLEENTFEVYGSLDALTSAGQDEARHEAGDRPQMRQWRAPSRRLIELLSNTALTQTSALRDLAADEERHRKESERWQRECQRLSTHVAELTAEKEPRWRHMWDRIRRGAWSFRRGGEG